MPIARKLLVSLLVGLGATSIAAGRNPPLPTPELLVDLARDWGLRHRESQTHADIQHVRALLEAAGRLDPRQADAWAWLYELCAAAEDRGAAAQALSRLLTADPEHETAFTIWLEMGLRGLQTAEEREAWLRAALAAERAAPQRAALHVELARLALERLDREAAQKELAQAVALEPGSMEAAFLNWQALPADAPPPARLSAALQVLSVQPLAIDFAWTIGRVLDDSGLLSEAQRFYEYASETQQRTAPEVSLPGGLLLDWAHNRAAADDLPRAEELVRRVISSDPQHAVEAAFFLHYLLLRQDQRAAARELQQQLAKRFAALTDPRGWPVNELAQAAWFYATLEQQPQRALMLARTAAELAPDDPFVQRVLGWALAVNLQPDEARNLLAPLATSDPYAAYMLARLRSEAGDAAGVEEALRSLRRWPRTGPALHLLAGLQAGPASQPTSLPATMPAGVTTLPVRPQPVVVDEERQQAELRAVLGGFQDDVLTFYRTPEHFLEASVAMDNPSLAAGEPWWATFALTNRGAFPITLGPDAMVNPVFLVSLTLEGDRARSYPALLTVSLDRTRVLDPGETVRVRRTLDVGPVRQVARTTPQQFQRVSVQAVLAAERGADGQWRPGLGGVALRPVYFSQLPVSVGRESLAALFAAVSGDSDIERVQALEVLAQLLGEQQRAQLTKLNYTPQPVPAARIQAALHEALRSPQWELQARTLDSLQIVGLDRDMTRAAEQSLAHPHWLVRLMALRVLARQGATFADQAAKIASDDPDEIVRELAASYVATWSGAAHTPASQPAAAP
jgi:tetratricopeptide (TPR) repeat protein